MTEDVVAQEILNVNARFYQALAQADLAAMEELWHHGQVTECVHPGWDRLRGWPAIQQSWARIFSHQGPMHVHMGDPMVHWRGDIGWVTCYENVVIRSGNYLQVSQMLATNVFERIEGRWKMVIHHVSPAPPEMPRPRSKQVYLN